MMAAVSNLAPQRGFGISACSDNRATFAPPPTVIAGIDIETQSGKMEGAVTGPTQIPATVEVVCGTLRGTYDVAKTKILYLSHMGGIREATPTEFERLGGRQATKKWKQVRGNSGGVALPAFSGGPRSAVPSRRPGYADLTTLLPGRVSESWTQTAKRASR